MSHGGQDCSPLNDCRQQWDHWNNIGCAVVVASNMIIISVIIIATILLVLIIYDIGSAIVAIIVIVRLMVDIIVMLITIFVGYHCPCCLLCLGSYHGHNCCRRYRRVVWVRHCLHCQSISGQDLIRWIYLGCKWWHCIIQLCCHQEISG